MELAIFNLMLFSGLLWAGIPQLLEWIDDKRIERKNRKPKKDIRI